MRLFVLTILLVLLGIQVWRQRHSTWAMADWVAFLGRIIAGLGMLAVAFWMGHFADRGGMLGWARWERSG